MSKGHTDAVEDVAPSPSGSAFCSGAWDGNVHIWRTGTALRACTPVRAIATSGALQSSLSACLLGHSGGALCLSNAMQVLSVSM